MFLLHDRPAMKAMLKAEADKAVTAQKVLAVSRRAGTPHSRLADLGAVGAARQAKRDHEVKRERDTQTQLAELMRTFQRG